MAKAGTTTATTETTPTTAGDASVLREDPASVSPAAQHTHLVSVDFGGRGIDIEVSWLRAGRANRPLLVFLHEGLGSVAMWRDFPRDLCDAAECRGLVLSRYGYGRFTPRPPEEKWQVDYMHRQAVEALPALFARLDIGPDRLHGAPWLVGHSDGGSIALIFAASFPETVAGLIVMAPHVVVEDLSVRSIEAARQAYLETGLRARLARYHADVDSAFWGWNDIWLDPAFRTWDIHALLPAIRCPLLAVQGVDDEYGTMAQIEGIQRYAPQTRLLKLPRCGHSPHRDQPEALTAEIVRFIHEQASLAVPG